MLHRIPKLVLDGKQLQLSAHTVHSQSAVERLAESLMTIIELFLFHFGLEYQIKMHPADTAG